MPILHLHRRELLLLQRARVHVEDGRVVYAQAMDSEAENDVGLVRRWNVPTLNVSILVLGQGCSVSQGAMRRFHDDGVMVAFTGTAGTPFLMASQSFRPGVRLQYWASRWADPSWRLSVAKRMHMARTEAVRSAWSALERRGDFNTSSESAIAEYLQGISGATNIAQLTAREGNFSKNLYRLASGAVGIRWNGRQPGMGLDRFNRNLDHGNYLAYGVASVALWAYGIPFSMAVTHGASRNGGLVFDLADTFKDAVVLPVCAQFAARGTEEGFRAAVVESLHGSSLDKANGTVGYAFRVLDGLFPSSVTEEAAQEDPETDTGVNSVTEDISGSSL